MNSFFKIFIFSVLFIISKRVHYYVSKPLHDIHLSICKINYNKESKSIELSFRFFTDDIEKAVKNYNGKKIISIKGKKIKEADKYLVNYILSKFSIKVKNNRINYDFIGWEIKETVIWCYIEIKNINLANKILVKNKLLIEIFSNQKNIIILNSGNYKKNIVFDRKKTEGIF